jgi:hypothetical protein
MRHPGGSGPGVSLLLSVLDMANLNQSRSCLDSFASTPSPEQRLAPSGPAPALPCRPRMPDVDDAAVPGGTTAV